MIVTDATRISCVDFHGVPVTRNYKPFAQDAFRALFSPFAPCVAAKDPIALEFGTSPAPLAGTPEDHWRPTFCHGIVQGYSSDGAHLLSDGQSRVEVLPRFSRMTGQAYERAHDGLFSGMQHIGLSLLLRERGIFDLHAATACTNRRALVLLGDSGAGKTTLLLCLMGVGCNYLGDDRLLFRASHRGAELLAYPREFHVSPATLELIPGIVPGSAATDGKYSLQPLSWWPERFLSSWCGPVSLLLPHVEGVATSTVRRATTAEAFGCLLSSSGAVAVDAIGRRWEQLEALRILADSADAYSVVLGADLLSEPQRTAHAILNELDALAR